MNIAGHGTAVTLLLDGDGKAQDFSVTPDADSEVPVGSVFVGRVEKLDRKTNGAFVRIAGGRIVFLPIRKNQTCGSFCMAASRPAEAQIRSGDVLLVQIDGEAVKTKLPHARGEIHLSGRFLAVTSGKPGLHFSSRLSPKDKIRLREETEKADPLFKEHCVIVRTAARSASGSEIAEELSDLCGRIDRMITIGKTRPAGTCLYRPFPWKHLLERLQSGDIVETDIEEVRDHAAKAGLSCVYHGSDGEEENALYRIYRIPAYLDRLTARRVYLKSGATLIIEQTEAFVAIDVNSGKFSKNLSHEDMARRLNFEAADAAFEQIRLRSLTGTILIDFLNMGKENEKELLTHLNGLAAKDPVTTVVVDITKLGIAEITRERTRLSLAEQLRNLKSRE